MIVCTILVFILANIPCGESLQNELTRCLHNIAMKEFPQEKPLVFSYLWSRYAEEETVSQFSEILMDVRYSIHFEDFLPTLLEVFNELNQSIVVVNNDYNITKSEGPSSFYGGYVILHYVQDDIKLQLVKLVSDSRWNPRANYIVVLIGNIKSNLHKYNVTQNIFSEFWKHNIIQVVVLININLYSRKYEREDEDKIATNVFELYTWYPYKFPGQCAQSYDPILIDRWTTNKSYANFTENRPIFSNKLTRYLNGCHLRISTFESEPVAMCPSGISEEGTLNYDDGLEIRVIKLIQRYTQQSIIYRAPPYHGKWGILLPNGTWTGVLREIIDGSSDIAFGEVYYRCHLEEKIECTISYMYDETNWYVPCAQPIPKWKSLSRVFKISLWIGFITGYIIVSILIWGVVRASNKVAKPGNESTTYINLTNCFTNLWAVILGISATEDIPKKTTIRMVFLLWVMYSLAVNTVYQTFLTSYMIDPGLQHQISSEDELLESNMDYGFVRTLPVLIPDLQAQRYSRKQLCADIEKCIRRMARKKDFAVLHSKYSTDYSAYVRYVDSNGNPLFCHLDETYSRQYVTMSVKKGHLLLGIYNRVIKAVIEGGFYDQWWKELKYLATLRAAANLTVPPGDYIPLSVDHMQSAFYILILGFTVAFNIFIYEVLHKKTLRMRIK
ncbi:Ionotropic receptor 208 [Blattella germanica]|nr:Ionotropic receptor 208 [Blattella germanica]